jgi:protein-arginine kinase activator protein McsA
MRCEACKKQKATVKISHKKADSKAYVSVNVCMSCYTNRNQNVDKLLYIKVYGK